MLDKMKHAVRAIDDELLGAEHYAKMARKCKGEDNASMQTYLAMAKQELSHVDALRLQLPDRLNATDAWVLFFLCLVQSPAGHIA